MYQILEVEKILYTAITDVKTQVKNRNNHDLKVNIPRTNKISNVYLQK